MAEVALESLTLPQDLCIRPWTVYNLMFH